MTGVEIVDTLERAVAPDLVDGDRARGVLRAVPACSGRRDSPACFEVAAPA